MAESGTDRTLNDGLDNTSENDSNETEEDLIVDLFIFICLILTLVFVLTSLCSLFILTCVKKRKNLCPNFLNRHIALVVPLNFLEERTKRKAFVAAFALVTISIIDETESLKFLKEVSPYFRLPVKLCIMTSVILTYFALMSCIHTASIFTCILGLIYLTVYLIAEIVYIYTDYLEGITFEEILHDDLLQTVINATAGLYLVYWFCKQIYELLKYGMSRKTIAKKYQITYVKNLLQPKRNRLASISCRKTSKFKELFEKHIYSSIPGFRYSLSILVSCTVGFLMISKLGMVLIYQVTKGLFEVSRIMEKYQDLKNSTFPNVVKMVVNRFYKTHDSDPDEINAFDLMNMQLTLVYVCLILAVVFGLLFNILTILHVLKSYRENVLNLARRKQQQNIMNISSLNNVNFVMSAIQFTGFQVSFFFFGFIMQTAFLALVFIVIGELTVLPMHFAMKGFFEWIASLIIPFLLVILVTKVLQYLLIKNVFLEDKGQTMALTNRRGFAIMMYSVFFYNVLSGFISCLVRIAKGAVLGLFLLPRLDRSVFPRTFERIDSDFTSYSCLLHLEALQSGPIITCFIHILQKMVKGHTKSLGRENKINKIYPTFTRRQNIKKACLRWFVAYTLIRNPTLVYDRKLNLLFNNSNETQ